MSGRQDIGPGKDAGYGSAAVMWYVRIRMRCGSAAVGCTVAKATSGLKGIGAKSLPKLGLAFSRENRKVNGLSGSERSSAW